MNFENNNKFLLDYANIDAGVGHSMGLFNSFIKIAIYNHLIPTYSEKQLKKSNNADFKFILKKNIKPWLGKGLAETHNIGNSMNDFFMLGKNEVSREKVESLIRRRKIKVIELPAPISPDKSIDDSEKYSEINNIISYYKDENNIAFVLPKGRKDGDCEYLSSRSWFLNKYKAARKLNPIESYFDTSKINVAIHIRRGDLLPGRGFSHLASRMLPDTWYASIINQLYELFGNKISVHIYSEGKNKKYFNELGIESNWNYCDMIDYPVDLFQHIDEPWYLDLEHMINADILVTAKSGFSHLAAVFNEKGIKLTIPMWHSFEGCTNILSVSDQNPSFDTKILKEFFINRI